MLEEPLERLLFAFRWLLAPLYLGLAISSIRLLRVFMNAQQTPNDRILWCVIRTRLSWSPPCCSACWTGRHSPPVASDGRVRVRSAGG